MSYFGSSQEEDLEDDEEEVEVVRNGSGIHSHGSGGSNSQVSAYSSCHSTPRKGKLPARQPLNGHGKDRTGALLDYIITELCGKGIHEDERLCQF